MQKGGLVDWFYNNFLFLTSICNILTPIELREAVEFLPDRPLLPAIWWLATEEAEEAGRGMSAVGGGKGAGSASRDMRCRTSSSLITGILAR